MVNIVATQSFWWVYLVGKLRYMEIFPIHVDLYRSKMLGNFVILGVRLICFSMLWIIDWYKFNKSKPSFVLVIIGSFWNEHGRRRLRLFLPVQPIMMLLEGHLEPAQSKVKRREAPQLRWLAAISVVASTFYWLEEGDCAPAAEPVGNEPTSSMVPAATEAEGENTKSVWTGSGIGYGAALLRYNWQQQFQHQ